MTTGQSLEDRLQLTREVRGDRVVYRFANGLVIETEVFHKSDRLRILPLGSPQGALMNHLSGFPERVRDRSVFEPFAGSGALGFMALALGARHADFLDVNPRAEGFLRANAQANGIPVDRYTSITTDIAQFVPEGRYDLLIANPPFVPTPDGIDGTLTSNGGPDGGRFVRLLLDRIETFLEPSGEALIYVFQPVVEGRPLMLDRLRRLARSRPVQITPCQSRPLPFSMVVDAYRKLFPGAREAIDRWQSDLVGTHGAEVGLCHYVLEIGERSADAECVIRNDFAARFGRSFEVPSAAAEELAFGRVFENFVPPSAPAS